MKHIFVFDPKAFFSQQWKMDNILDNIGQFFRTQEKPDWSIQMSRYRRDAVVIINEEVEKAEPGDIIRVYAVGGEEILYDCVNAAAHFPEIEMEVAAIPYGETNNFLNVFGEDKIEAFKDLPAVIKSGSLPTDIIQWGENYALNSCYIGLNSAMASRVRDLKTRSKGISILFSKISGFFNYFAAIFNKEIASQYYKISIDGMDHSGKYSLIHVANGPYHNGKLTGLRHATPSDGLLDIALVRSGAFTPVLAINRYSSGKRPKNAIFLQAKKISIQSDKQMWIQLDNEYIRDTSINVSVVPSAIQMAAVEGASYPEAAISGL